MELLTELVKFADSLDKQGLTDLANQLDALVIEAAKKKEESAPMLSVHVRPSDDEENVWNVKVDAPSGVAPYDPVVHAYIQKYSPFQEGMNLKYKEMKSNSDPNKPNTFIYELRGPDGPQGKSDSLPPAISSDVVDSLVKIADELDNAGATDLADKIDGLIQGV